ncbi:MAG: hypothetical protein HKN05_16555 [Rhizobiales bacterium]|nr:hypothetical protein [Hyphomicrobiales bacterium]
MNTAVWRARQALSQCGKSQEGFLVTTADGKVGFQADADYWCDAEEFEALATSALSESEPAANGGSIANLEASLRIYRGELLEGLYDDWALCERLRLSDLHERVLHRLMILLADSGALDRAIYYGNTLISADPLREDIHCSLMEYYHRQGNYNHCRRQYERCREAVKRELQCEPLEETTRLHHQLLKGSHRAKSDTSLPTAGRGGHLDEIRHSLRDAQAQLDRASKLFNQLITR